MKRENQMVVSAEKDGFPTKDKMKGSSLPTDLLSLQHQKFFLLPQKSLLRFLKILYSWK